MSSRGRGCFKVAYHTRTFAALTCLVSLAALRYPLARAGMPAVVWPATQPIRTAEPTMTAQAKWLVHRTGGLRALLSIYSMEHNGAYPTLRDLEQWRVMLNKTTDEGFVGVQGAIHGPYLSRLPVNCLTGKTAVCDELHLDANAGWVITMYNGEPVLCALIPNHPHPALQWMLREHLAIVSPKAQLAEKAAVAGALADNPLLQRSPTFRKQELNTAAEFETLMYLMAIWTYARHHDGNNPTLEQLTDRLTMADYLPWLPQNPLMHDATGVTKAGHARSDAGWTYNAERGQIRLIVPATYDAPAEWTTAASPDAGTLCMIERLPN